MKLFTLILFLFPLPFISSGQPAEQFALANEAYNAGQSQAAIPAYEELLDQGFRSVALYYNLGNAYYQNGHLARAIINYERALLIDKNDEEVLYNLTIAREKAEDEIQPLPPFFLITWWRTLRDSLPSGAWALLSCLSLWIAISGFALWMLSSKRDIKKLGFVTGFIFLFFTLLPVVMGAQRTVTENQSQYAIVLDEEIELRIAPSEVSKEILTMHEGSKVELMDKLGSDCDTGADCWLKVQLANGEEGWLPSKSIERI